MEKREKAYEIGAEVNLPNDKEGYIMQCLDNRSDDWNYIYFVAVYGEEEVKIYTEYTLDKYN